MLQNAYFLAKIGADTAENEQHFAEILPKTSNYPTGPPGRVTDNAVRDDDEHHPLKLRCTAGRSVVAHPLLQLL